MAHYALQKLHILPSTFNNMSRGEKQFVYASILVRAESEKEDADKLEKASKKRR